MTERMSAESLHLLGFVRELLSPPGAWTRKAFARTSSGASTLAGDPNAVCWCLTGALYRAMLVHRIPVTDETLALELEIGKNFTSNYPELWRMAEWNDAEGRTQEEVLTKIDSILAANRVSA